VLAWGDATADDGATTLVSPGPSVTVLRRRR